MILLSNYLLNPKSQLSELLSLVVSEMVGQFFPRTNVLKQTLEASHTVIQDVLNSQQCVLVFRGGIYEQKLVPCQIKEFLASYSDIIQLVIVLRQRELSRMIDYL